jgi:two-component system chemotaxis response regulator CheB
MDLPAAQPTDETQVGLLGVLGASAGGLAALRRVLAELPADFRGTLCIVMHLAPNRPSYLARILDRESAVPVETARHGQPLAPGRIYAAPPDHHLVVQGSTLRLVVGPNENGHRPAIDTLFRSAAHSFGPAAVGVVLSGSLDDGAAGLREIKARGGRALVQRPDDADYPSMPLAALEGIHPDMLGTADEIGRWLAEARVPPRHTGYSPSTPPEITAPQPLLTCPDCHGPLHEVVDGHLLRFDCLIGHRWSLGSLEAFQRTDVESSLWAALRALEEQAVLNRRLAGRSSRDHRPRATASFTAAADRAEEHAAVLREIVKHVAAASAEVSIHGSEAEDAEVS